MRETSKAQRRRCKETSEGKFDWDKIFKGDILDVGCGDDPLTLESVISLPRAFYDDRPIPRITCIDAPDGAGDDIAKFVGDDKFDCVHGSNVLEHALNPVVMLKSWIACLKLGGYIVATVPDYELYEKKQFPSRWNAGHRSTWSLDFEKRLRYAEHGTPDCGNPNCPTCYAPHCKLPEWLNQFLNTDKPCDLVLCRLIDTSDHSLPDDVDQTFPEDGAEVFIEFVLRRI